MLTKSAKETQKLAKDFAGRILRDEKNRSAAFVLALKGELGGGKTTFLQGFAKGLGVKEKILSPTYNIYKRYCIGEQFSYFYHFDCYRIEKQEEILALGLREIISNSQNIVAIEWAEKIKNVLPKNTKWVNFIVKGENTRSVDVI